jgi:uncharacterized iron-regulated membrane protein
MTSAFHQETTRKTSPIELAASYRLIWRWHFYAGLFCLPFIVILSLSGSVYLFKPQIDSFLDRNFDHLTLVSQPKTLDEQVEAALAANPNSRIKGVQLREDRTDAARVHLMTSEGKELRVLVRPDTLDIMKSETQKGRFTSIMRNLHGELLAGEAGAVAVELAGAWAIVMVITGLYLWWPRSSNGLAGVLYPRLGGGRRLLRDLHAVTGIWLSFFALFFLISALPWTKVWGEGFRFFRSVGQTHEVRQDWTTGPASEQAQRMENYRNSPAARGEAPFDEHAEHRGVVEHKEHMRHAGHGAPGRITGFDKIAAQAAPLRLADPAYILPPSAKRPNWTARSESQNRPARNAFEFDPRTFEIVKEKRFSDKALIDRVIGIGVAAHEGQLFGWFNQLLGLVTALGYMMLAVTSALMWWRRRPKGALGAPPAVTETRRLGPIVIGLIAVLGVLLPTLGISLLAVLAAEQALRRFAPGVAAWLGLRLAPAPGPRETCSVV